MDSNQNNDKNKVLDYLALQSFVDELIAKRKPDIPSGELPKYKESLMLQVLEAVNSRLVGLLSESKQAELEKLLDESVEQPKLYAFFEQNIPNLVAEITLSMAEFREGYLIDLSTLPDLPPMPIKK